MLFFIYYFVRPSGSNTNTCRFFYYNHAEIVLIYNKHYCCINSACCLGAFIVFIVNKGGISVTKYARFTNSLYCLNTVSSIWETCAPRSKTLKKQKRKANYRCKLLVIKVCLVAKQVVWICYSFESIDGRIQVEADIVVEAIRPQVHSTSNCNWIFCTQYSVPVHIFGGEKIKRIIQHVKLN